MTESLKSEIGKIFKKSVALMLVTLRVAMPKGRAGHLLGGPLLLSCWHCAVGWTRTVLKA